MNLATVAECNAASFNIASFEIIMGVAVPCTCLRQPPRYPLYLLRFRS
jgi:hypothetical protein